MQWKQGWRNLHDQYRVWMRHELRSVECGSDPNRAVYVRLRDQHCRDSARRPVEREHFGRCSYLSRRYEYSSERQHRCRSFVWRASFGRARCHCCGHDGSQHDRQQRCSNRCGDPDDGSRRMAGRGHRNGSGNHGRRWIEFPTDRPGIKCRSDLLDDCVPDINGWREPALRNKLHGDWHAHFYGIQRVSIRSHESAMVNSDGKRPVLMSGASSYATTIPSFQSCPSSGGGGGAVGYSGAPVVTATVYVPLMGDTAGSTTRANVGWPAPSAAPISNLQAYSSSVPGTGNTLVVTLYDGSTAEALTCTITAAA